LGAGSCCTGGRPWWLIRGSFAPARGACSRRLLFAAFRRWCVFVRYSPPSLLCRGRPARRGPATSGRVRRNGATPFGTGHPSRCPMVGWEGTGAQPPPPGGRAERWRRPCRPARGAEGTGDWRGGLAGAAAQARGGKRLVAQPHHAVPTVRRRSRGGVPLDAVLGGGAAVDGVRTGASGGAAVSFGPRSAAGRLLRGGGGLGLAFGGAGRLSVLSRSSRCFSFVILPGSGIV
jgi:hypothetical protein